MVTVIVHVESALYLGSGFALVGRDDAIQFADALAAQALLKRHASEPCFVISSERIGECRTA
jgi:hypothetical protein